ncbi:MAG: family 10 glycosylhydrolase [Candidatus Latescibacterota bacterium]|nr:family 10 glycosylhydrolase [Candidatus Latescibacterota bacterium]
MRRRQFIKIGIGATAALSWGRRLEGEEVSSDSKNWTWINTDPATDDDEWRRRFARARENGIDAVLPEVFNNHLAYWHSQHLPVGDAGWLERLVLLAHEAGLEIHAWIHCMTCNIPEIMQAHPEWYDVNRNGESAVDKPAYVDYYRFLCPSRPGVQDFLRHRVSELAAIEGLDGIHLDYIRFPDVILAEGLQPNYNIVQDREYPEYDYCYCDLCRSDFKAASGIDPLTDLDDPSASAEWKQFRYDRISTLVNEHLIPVGRAAGRQMTAAVFPNWEHVRQEWHVWDLDAVLPMIYNSFYNEGIDWIRRKCEEGVARMEAKGMPKPLYSGLFVPGLTPGELKEAVAASAAGGAAGVSLFPMGGMSDEHWEALRGRARP